MSALDAASEGATASSQEPASASDPHATAKVVQATSPGGQSGVSALQDREGTAAYRAPRVNLSLADFNILGRSGDGSFSTVVLAESKASGRKYALKIINKHLVMRNKMVDYVRNERNILDQLDHDGICKLHFTFQDEDSLYMGLEHCSGGELYDQIRKKGRLSLEATRFYAGEIVLILEYLRIKTVIHRDLKPENLLLTGTGHLKLVDFGSAKAFFLPSAERRNSTQTRATSFVGTAEYVSPEVLSNLEISYAADLWALGCTIFQMLTGASPFKAGSEYLTFQKVSDRDFSFPDDFPPAARDLVDKLLVVEASQRLGAEDISELKAHDFFAGLPWDTLRSAPSPEYVPPSPPRSDDEGLDWEMTSLASFARSDPIQYEYTT